MGEWWLRLDIGMVFSVGSEGSGGLQNFLQTEILEDSLGNEEVQLGVESPAEMELHQHVTTTLTVSTLEEMFPRLGVLLQLPQTVCEVLTREAGLLCYCFTHNLSYLVEARMTHGRVCVFTGPLQASGQIHWLVNVITGNQLIQPEHNSSVRYLCQLEIFLTWKS